MTISARAAGKWAGGLAAVLAGPLACLAVHWFGLWAWFQADDFAFLGLHRKAVGWNAWWRAVLGASPHGTLRPFSERAYFLLFWHWFGFDAFYYHACTFLTQAAALTLLYWVVWRVSRSRLAATLAPVLWTVNASHGEVMAWACAYNEVLCGLCLLAAFALWLKFEETGRRRYYAAQTAVFLLGFGVLELNIVYPALAAGWALARGRRWMLPWTIPLATLSGAYFFLHARIAAVPTEGPYAMHFNPHVLLSGLALYSRWAIVLDAWKNMRGYSPGAEAVVIALVGGAALLFVVWEARARKYVPLFFAFWFLATLAPLLPLRDHRSAYYLAIPSLGVAVILALLAARYRAGIAVSALYIAVAVPAARKESRYVYERSLEARNLVLGVKRATELHPGTPLLLTEISTDLYRNAIVDHPFRIFTDTPVLLAPEVTDQAGQIDRGWLRRSREVSHVCSAEVTQAI